MKTFSTRAGLVLLALLLVGAEAAAQTGLASERLGPGYWHVFIAYAVAWALVLGWVVSIARRLAGLERRLGRE